MIKPEEDIVGCQVFCAYSTQKVFVWLYLAEASGEGTVHWECSHAYGLLPWREGWPGFSQALFIPVRWQVPLEPAVFQFWKEKAEHTHVNMVCCCLGLAEEYIISLLCTVLVTFISVAECGAQTVLSLLCANCTPDFTDSLNRNYRWCRMVPLTVSANICKYPSKYLVTWERN